MDDLKIGILFGGASYEHDISIISAYQVQKKLKETYEIHMLYLSTSQKLYLADAVKLADFKKEKLKKLKKTMFKKGGIKQFRLDAVVGCMHGENGEDGLAAALCRFYEIPYLGSDLFASALAMDKADTYYFLKGHNLPVIESTVYTYEDYLDNKELPYFPCILKPVCGGSSIGISVCRTKEEQQEQLIRSFEYGKKLLVQPFYDHIEEYNLALNETTYSNLEKIAKKDAIFTFENKYTDAFKQMHQSLIDDALYPEFCALARKVYDSLGCSGIIRIDFFLLDDQILINEINTTPGALSIYLFADFKQVFADSLLLCLRKKRNKPEKKNFLKNSEIQK